MVDVPFTSSVKDLELFDLCIENNGCTQKMIPNGVANVNTLV